MLIEFRVENHRSIREEQVLTMEASGPEVARVVDGHRKPLTCVAAIYGANASGKSNLLSALAYARAVVVYSHRLWEPEGGVPRDPFAWGEFRRKPSLYEITFVQDKVRYRYGFVLDDAAVAEEWLHAWPHGRRQVWFERDRGKMKFGDALGGENRVVEELTRNNALFLSAAAQLRHEQLLPVYRWFGGIASVNIRAPRGVPFEDYLLSRAGFGELSLARALAEMDDEGADVENQRVITEYSNILRAADVGILDFKAEHDPERPRHPSLYFLHESDEGDSWLPLRQESDGTKVLLQIAQPVISALARGHLVIIDELERSLHPLLARYVLRLFGDPSRNPNHAQVLFTTHDTNLIGTSAGPAALTREQIWLTEKNRSGATVLYPLTDYKPRKQENLERGYLQGRYGAIPFLGQLLEVKD
jgi:uncharacterized protein